MKSLLHILLLTFIGVIITRPINCNVDVNVLEVVVNKRCEAQNVCSVDCSKIIPGCKVTKPQHFLMTLEKNFLDHRNYRKVCVLDDNSIKIKGTKPKIFKDVEKIKDDAQKILKGKKGRKLNWALRRVIEVMRLIVRICREGAKSEEFFQKRLKFLLGEIKRLPHKEVSRFDKKDDQTKVSRMLDSISEYEKGKMLTLIRFKRRAFRMIRVFERGLKEKKKYYQKYRDLIINKFRNSIKYRRISNEGFCTCERIRTSFEEYRDLYLNYQKTKTEDSRKKVAGVVFDDIAGNQGDGTRGRVFYNHQSTMERAVKLYEQSIQKLTPVFQERARSVRERCLNVCGMKDQSGSSSKSKTPEIEKKNESVTKNKEPKEAQAPTKKLSQSKLPIKKISNPERVNKKSQTNKKPLIEQINDEINEIEKIFKSQ